WAAENVERQGYKTYLPLVGERTRNGLVVRPLFPRYLFVQTNGQWRFLMGTYGVSLLVMDGNKPAVLPDQQLEALRSREDLHGLVELPGPESLSIGQKVVVK